MNGISIMNKSSIVVLLAIGALVNHQAAGAVVPERASAHEYAAIGAQASTQTQYPQQSTVPPAAVASHLHSTVVSRVTTWVWTPKTIFSQNTMVYAGWSQNRLINVMHFWTNGSQEVYQRQYIVHYENLPSGLESVTVDRYVASGSSEEYVGQTQYLSSVVNNKLYLARATFTNQYQKKLRELDIDWSKNGVKATMVNGSQNRFAATQEISLRATESLKQNFDLWDSFGLKLN
jgi:asparagine N-glycosylation enzyme membrane subunit Stt3